MSRIIATALVFFATITAAQAEPLLQVTKASGFVRPQNSYQLECAVGSSFTVERLRLGEPGRLITRTHPTRFTRTLPSPIYVRRAIAIAANGRLMTTPGRTDMPTSSYFGLLGARRVTLLIDRSIQRTRNLATSVPSLLQLANLNCPTP